MSQELKSRGKGSLSRSAYTTGVNSHHHATTTTAPVPAAGLASATNSAEQTANRFAPGGAFFYNQQHGDTGMSVDSLGVVAPTSSAAATTASHSVVSHSSAPSVEYTR